MHPINEDKFDNSTENLIVFKTRSDHSAFHKGRKIHLKGDVWVADNVYLRKTELRTHIAYVLFVEKKSVLRLKCVLIAII